MAFARAVWTWSGQTTTKPAEWLDSLNPVVGLGVGALGVGLHQAVGLEVAGLPWYTVAVGVACLPLPVVLARAARTKLHALGPADLRREGPWLAMSALMLVKGLVWIFAEDAPWVWLVMVVEVPGLIVWGRLAERAAPFELSVDTVGAASVQAMDEALFLVSPQGRVDYANPAAERLLGRSPHGRPFQEVCPAWPTSGPTAMRRTDGASLQVMLQYTPITMGIERVGFAVSASDVTEMQRALDEAREARVRADEASRAKQEFVAVMSHEIRTPMNAIVGLAHLLDETDLDPQQARWTHTIRESSDALLAMITDILDFSRIEAGRLELEEIPFAPGAMLSGAASLVETTARKKGLVFEADLGGLPPGVVGDPTRVRQSVLNLLSNAVKFTDSGEVRLTASYTAGHLHLSVSDTGPGIAPEVVPTLFQAFTQADASTTRRFGGTGLGLTISRQLAEQMGGTLSVESTLGVGSRFCLELPVPVAELNTAEHAPSALPVTEKRLRVLVVEDNPVNHTVMAAVLDHLGMDATLAVDGARHQDDEPPHMAGVRALVERVEAQGPQVCTT